MATNPIYVIGKDGRSEMKPETKIGLGIAGAVGVILTGYGVYRLGRNSTAAKFEGELADTLTGAQEQVESTGDIIDEGLKAGQATSEAIINQDWEVAFLENTKTVNALYDAKVSNLISQKKISEAKEAAALKNYKTWSDKYDQQVRSNVGLWFTIIGGIAGTVASSKMKKERDLAQENYNKLRTEEVKHREKLERDIQDLQNRKAEWNTKSGSLYAMTLKKYRSMRLKGYDANTAKQAISTGFKSHKV